jgi:hypothetical protein
MQKLDSESYEILGTVRAWGYKDAYLELQGGGILGVIIPELEGGENYALLTPNWGLGVYKIGGDETPLFVAPFCFDTDGETAQAIWRETCEAMANLDDFLAGDSVGF